MCRLDEAITPKERAALQALANSLGGITTPLPETHGVVLLSTRDGMPLPVVDNLPFITGRVE